MKMIATLLGVVIFIAVCWWLAIFYSKKTVNLDQYLVSGRAVGFWVLIGSWIGGFCGGSTVAGFMGYGYHTGMLRYLTILPASIFLILFVVVFAKRLSVLGAKYHLVSIPDFLALRYGNYVRIPAVIFVFFRMGFIVGLQIMALGLVFMTGFGCTLKVGMGIGFLVLCGYVAVGGMMASIVVEWFQSLLQSIIMITMCILGMIWIGGDGGIFAAFDNAYTVMNGLGLDPKSEFSLNPWDLPMNQVVNYLICMGFYYLGDQWAFQRVFAASKPEVAFKCLTWGNVLATFFATLPFLAGVMIRAANESGAIMIPAEVTNNNVFFYVIMNLVPTGLSVFFLVCYMAAVLSCGSSFLMGGAPLVVRDIYQTFINKEANDKKLILIGRVSVVIIAVFGITAAFLIPDLVLLFNMGNVFTACGVLVPILCAFFWKRATSRGGIMGSWIGGLTGLGSCIYSVSNGGTVMIMPNGIPIVVIGLLASLAAMIIFSLTQKADPEDVVNKTYYGALATSLEE